MASDVHAWIQFGSGNTPIPRDGSVRIGRSIESDLRLFQETSISRDHCVIRSHKGRLEVTDLGSRNGTRVNGRRIKEAMQLQHRDVVKVGESELTILLEIEPGSRGSTTEIPLMS